MWSSLIRKQLFPLIYVAVAPGQCLPGLSLLQLPRFTSWKRQLIIFLPSSMHRTFQHFKSQSTLKKLPDHYQLDFSMSYNSHMWYIQQQGLEGKQEQRQWAVFEQLRKICYSVCRKKMYISLLCPKASFPTSFKYPYAVQKKGGLRVRVHLLPGSFGFGFGFPAGNELSALPLSHIPILLHC